MRIENSFLLADGVGETIERRLWEAGITHWDEFGECSVRGVGTETRRSVETFIDAAYDRLDAGDAAFFADRLPTSSRWRLYESFRPATCYFDIETTGLDPGYDEVTTVSFHRAGETTTLVRGRDLTRDAVARELDAAELLVSFNGLRFDQPFIEDSFDLSIETPHLDLMYPCRRLGLSGGLKRIERDLGIDRAIDDVDGREAVRLWYRYRRGDDGALDTLVEYNRADAETLETLSNHVVSQLDRDVFDPFR